jgi:putative membrane protein
MQTIDWSISRRQSWAAVLFVALRLIKVGYKAFGILAISIILKGKFSWIIFGLIIVIILLAFFISALIQFLFFTFSIKDGVLQVNQGIFIKKRIHLPVSQIQSVHTDQTLWHRITQTSRIKLDSPGSEKTEVTIDALSEQNSEFLIQQLSAHLKDTQSTTEQLVEKKFLLQRSVSDLIKWSLTINHFQTIALIFAFGLTLLNDLEQAFNWKSYDRIEEGLVGFDPGLLLVFGGTLSLLIVIVFVSILFTIYRNYGFTVKFDNNGFGIKAGLIHVHQWSIPIRKIQVWEFRTNWIRRFFKQIRLEWQTIGEQKERTKQKPWAPLFGDNEMKAILEQVGFSFPLSWNDGKRIHSAYLTRFYIVAITIVILGGVIAWKKSSVLWIGMASGLSFLILTHGWIFRKRFLYICALDGLWIRKGIWGTQRIFLPWKNIQFQCISQSIFQRKSDLSTLYLRTAAGSYAIPFIPSETARDISENISNRLQTDQAKWN